MNVFDILKALGGNPQTEMHTELVIKVQAGDTVTLYEPENIEVSDGGSTLTIICHEILQTE